MSNIVNLGNAGSSSQFKYVSVYLIDQVDILDVLKDKMVSALFNRSREVEVYRYVNPQKRISGKKGFNFILQNFSEQILHLTFKLGNPAKLSS